AALCLEDGEHLGVALIAIGAVVERTDEAVRRILSRWGIDIHAEGGEDLSHIALKGAQLCLGDAARAQLHRREIGRGFSPLVYYNVLGGKLASHCPSSILLVGFSSSRRAPQNLPIRLEVLHLWLDLVARPGG